MNPPPPSAPASLLHRLRRALLMLALVPLLLGSVILLVSNGLDKHADLQLTYERRAARVAEMTQKYVLETQDHLSQAQRFWNYGALPAADQSRILHDILAAHEEFVVIDYLSPTAEPRLRAARSDIGAERAQHLREETAITQALASGEVVFGQVTVDAATAEPALNMAMPVKAPGNGPTVGLLAAKLTFKPVSSELGRMVRGTPDDACVLSSDQRIVAHVNPSLVLADTRYAPPPASGVHRDLQGRLALVTVRQVALPGNALTVVITRPLVSAYGVILIGGLVGLVLLLATIGLALLLLRHLERWLLNPIAILTEAAERIRADEKDVRVQGRFDGEVAILAETFNLMLDRLDAEQAALEQRVQERTVSLSIAREAADRANQAKSDFLSSMSHELRTPMNAILGFGQLMEYDDTLPAEHRDSMGEILKAGNHLLELINEVLDLAKVESGRIELSMEGVDLHALTEDCRHLIQPIADKAGIGLSFDLPAERAERAECAVFADRVRLKQVLLNLLSNAIKYNRPGGTVRLTAATGQPGQLRIAVTDTGHGIPPE
ncbi:MAG: histidine kinase dimerization/phospho-acceptor domain-containing protein, partial [Rhodocyclaceae bacterium]|nr:histidine kinase dimerization/phospho-acceptor domain-containing protein [Rhodocyclaceae bacterium]